MKKLQSRPNSYIILFVTAVVTALMLLASCSGSSSEPEDLQQRIEDQIRSVLTLHTAEYIYRDVLYFGEQNQLFGFIPTGNREILFSVNISVRAGLDLNKGFRVDVSNLEQIVLELPPAEIIYSDVDEQSIHQYFLRQNRASISFLAVQDVIARAKQDIVADAIDRGILVSADRHAREIMTNLLQGWGRQVVILSSGSEAAE